MRVQIWSDLHLEFNPPEDAFTDIDIVGDVLVLAGDIHNKPKRLAEFLQKINKVPIIIVMGNHEHYGSILEKTAGRIKKEIGSLNNVHFLDDDSVVLESFPEYVFHGCTLWSHLPEDSKIRNEVSESMNDYWLIRSTKRNYGRIIPAVIEHKHAKSVHILKESLTSHPGKKHIVVTHHAPSFMSVPIRYAGKKINHAYVTDLEDLINNTSPVLWCHGHTHDSFNYTIGNTKVVCNPYGYYEATAQNYQFSKHLCVEV